MQFYMTFFVIILYEFKKIVFYANGNGDKSMLATGQNAPLFSLPTDQGFFSLAEHHGKNVIIFFFPKADTSGCTKEAVAFSELKAEFEAANSLVIGISKDTPEKQAKFRAKHNLSCLLGADFNTDVCEQFGVWVEKSMYGKKYMGIERSTFLFDENLQLIQSWRKVKVSGHAEEVLNSID